VTDPRTASMTMLKAVLGIAALLVLFGAVTVYFDSALFAAIVTLLIGSGSVLYRRRDTASRAEDSAQTQLDDYDSAE